MFAGWNVTVLRMIYISPKVKLLKTHRTCRISLHINKIHDIFPLLRLMTQCQVRFALQLDTYVYVMN